MQRTKRAKIRRKIALQIMVIEHPNWFRKLQMIQMVQIVQIVQMIQMVQMIQILVITENKYNYNEVIHSIANYLLMDIKEIIIVHHHIYSTVDMWICM